MDLSFLIPIVIVLIVFAIVAALFYYLGKRNLKKQEEAQAQIAATKQTVSMLVIDKKRLRPKDSGLPESVTSQIPWFMSRFKMPIVKAKIGPQILCLACDEKIFDDVPVKKEIKAQISGMYIVGISGLRGKLPPAPKKKKNRFQLLLEKAQEKAGTKPAK